jgi:hypothetical protein
MTVPITFELHLATPMIIHSEMDEAAFAFEFARMQLRAQATSDLVSGCLDVADYLDILDDSGIDIDVAMNDWRNGLSYMGG